MQAYYADTRGEPLPLQAVGAYTLNRTLLDTTEAWALLGPMFGSNGGRIPSLNDAVLTFDGSPVGSQKRRTTF